jgi:hypothetical protein
MHLISIISFKLGYVSISKRRTSSPLFLSFSLTYRFIFRSVSFWWGKYSSSLVAVDSKCINWNGMDKKSSKNCPGFCFILSGEGGEGSSES